MNTGLDNINRVVHKGAHSSRNKSNGRRLVAGQLGDILEALEVSLQEVVCGEVGGLVGGLTEGGETDTAVKGAEALLADDGEGAVGGVAVLGNVKGVGHRVALGLKTDLDHVHGGHDQDCLCHTGKQTSYEGWRKDGWGKKILALGGQEKAWES